MLRLVWLAVLTALVAVPPPAVAADHSLLGTKLVLKRSGTKEKLVFTTRDPALLFPAIGSADDPGTGSPGGAVIELFSAGEGAATLAAPSGVGSPGWQSRSGVHDRHQFANVDAPAPPSPIRLLLIRSGKGLRITARSTGLPLAVAQGTIGLRVTMGSLRNCVLFDPPSILNDDPGRFVARDGATVADCSNASLGGPGPCGDTAPTCNGTCAAGEECLATFNDNQCVCLPAGSTACGTPGAPTCGGQCPSGQGCVPAFTPIQQGGGVSCGCGLQACGNGFAFGIDDFNQPGCFPIFCAGAYPTCGGGCGDGGECSAVHVVSPSIQFCLCALPASCCAGGYECAPGSVCTIVPGCSCAPP
jgi:hypothetical protein